MDGLCHRGALMSSDWLLDEIRPYIIDSQPQQIKARLAASFPSLHRSLVLADPPAILLNVFLLSSLPLRFPYPVVSAFCRLLFIILYPPSLNSSSL